MSTVTDVILTCGLGDAEIGLVNQFFANDPSYGDAVLHRVDKPPGAEGKAVQADVYLGAFNCLDLGAFVDHLRALERVDTLHLFVQEEHDEYGFHEVEIW